MAAKMINQCGDGPPRVQRGLMTGEEHQQLIARESGEWAREKLEVLACYARGFVKASKTADRGCFVDGLPVLA